MERELTILLVEDDPQTCHGIVAYTDTLDDTILIAVTDHSEKAVQIVQDSMPDAMILDLELHRGTGNGLSILQALQKLALPKVPYILITTNNSSATTYEAARQFGADFILSKHQSDYSAKTPIDFLRMMKTIIQNRGNQTRTEAVVESPEYTNKRIIRKICAELNQIGISPKAVGYQYLVDGIQIIIQTPTQNLCSIIGRKYGKTEFSVERAMQNAIERAWKTTPIDDLLSLYTAKINSNRGIPTTTEFIYYYAKKIKNEF